MRPLFHVVVVFAISIASLSVGNILLKQGMDRFGAMTTAGTPTVQALIRTPQLSFGIVLMIIPFVARSVTQAEVP